MSDLKEQLLTTVRLALVKNITDEELVAQIIKITGAEFYNRFVEECKELYPDHPSIFSNMYDAAKRAAKLDT